MLSEQHRMLLGLFRKKLPGNEVSHEKLAALNAFQAVLFPFESLGAMNEEIFC